MSLGVFFLQVASGYVMLNKGNIQHNPQLANDIIANFACTDMTGAPQIPGLYCFMGEGYDAVLRHFPEMRAAHNSGDPTRNYYL